MIIEVPYRNYAALKSPVHGMSVSRWLDGLASPDRPIVPELGFPDVAFRCGMRPTATQALLSGIGSLAMTTPLNRFLVLVAAALTLLAVMLSTGLRRLRPERRLLLRRRRSGGRIGQQPRIGVRLHRSPGGAGQPDGGAPGLGWSVDIPMSEWDGVTLSEPDDDAAESPPRWVIELDLGFKELTGEVPSQLAELTNLESLSLRNNEFTGPVPSWIVRTRLLGGPGTCDATSLPAPSPPGLAASSPCRTCT